MFTGVSSICAAELAVSTTYFESSNQRFNQHCNPYMFSGYRWQEPNQSIRTSRVDRFYWFGSVTHTEPNHLKQEPSEAVRSVTKQFNHGSDHDYMA